MGTFEVSDGNIGSVWNPSDDHGRQPSRWRRAGFVPVVLAAGLALASCGGDSDSSAGTTIAAGAAATVAPAATAAPASPVATSAESVAPGGAEGGAEATSCPVGYVEFDGVYPLRICDQGATVTLLQEGLVDLGYDIAVDGLFGPQTQAALLDAVPGGNGEIATQADLDALIG